MAFDPKYLREALKEAAKAASKDEVPVGAVVVFEGKIIARGHNLRETRACRTAGSSPAKASEARLVAASRLRGITPALSHARGCSSRACATSTTAQPTQSRRRIAGSAFTTTPGSPPLSADLHRKRRVRRRTHELFRQAQKMSKAKAPCDRRGVFLGSRWRDLRSLVRARLSSGLGGSGVSVRLVSMMTAARWIGATGQLKDQLHARDLDQRVHDRARSPRSCLGRAALPPIFHVARGRRWSPSRATPGSPLSPPPRGHQLAFGRGLLVLAFMDERARAPARTVLRHAPALSHRRPHALTSSAPRSSRSVREHQTGYACRSFRSVVSITLLARARRRARADGRASATAEGFRRAPRNRPHLREPRL